jgi:hypothetical protein
MFEAVSPGVGRDAGIGILEMPENQNRPPAYAQALGLGFVSGLRAALGPALVAEIAPPNVKLVFRLLAVGELVADKLPKTPNRIDPGPLTGRIVSGAVVGYVVSRHAGRSVWVGALLGGIAAVGGSYGGYYGRRLLGQKLHLPDPIIAVAEDAIGVGLGRYFSP